MASNQQVPLIPLGQGGRKIPVLGMGTAEYPPVSFDTIVNVVLEAIEIGYRHFDTASLYGTEEAIGVAIAKAIEVGLVGCRDDLFITSKLWCSDAHGDRVVPAIQKTLRNLKMDYIDLYIIHWPVSSKPGTFEYPIKKEDLIPIDYTSVWAAMEQCHKLGLAKAIGVSNFTCKKLANLLANATIPPAVNQVEVNPVWQQKKLIDFCKKLEIVVVAYAALGSGGASYGTNRVMESEVLKEIAISKEKTVAQVCLRWAYEQGIGVLVKSFNKDRMRENFKIFDWELSEEELKKIDEISQSRACLGVDYISPNGPFKTIEELWDGEI